MRSKNLAIIIALVFLAAACNRNTTTQPKIIPPALNQENPNERFEFAQLDPTFRFSAEIPENLKAEYVSSIESINIYDPESNGSNLDKSQIFIRYFTASNFLTLTTVDVLSRQETKANNHPAVEYEIKKKAGVAAFPDQPSWLNEKHKLIDIRLSSSSPSTFYVFAYNPELDKETFDRFIESVVFHNDTESLSEPIEK